MSVMTWDEFLDAYPRSHLVVAWLHVRQRTGEVRLARFDPIRVGHPLLAPPGDIGTVPLAGNQGLFL